MRSLTVPLEELTRGEWAEVDRVQGDTGWVQRMAELGLRQGQTIQMLQPGSPCLVSLGGSRLSLRLNGAGRIWVRRANGTLGQSLGHDSLE